MKLKKTIAALLSVGMLATSMVSVSASITTSTDEDNWVIIDSMPEQSTVEARKPKIDVKIEKIANADFGSIDTQYSKSYAKKTDSVTGAYLYDMYQVTYTFSNFGDIAVGYDADYKKAGVAVSALKIYEDFSTTKSKIVASKAAGGFTGYTSSYGFESDTSTVLNYEHYISDSLNAYPFYGTEEAGAVNEATTFTLSQLVVLNAGDTANFTLKSDSGMTFAYIKANIPNSAIASATLPTENSFTLGAVAKYPTSVTISNKTSVPAMNIGDTFTLNTTVAPADADADKKTVTWSSSNTAVATVNNGVVTAVGAGTATITASVKTGAAETAVATDTVTITVNQPTPPAFKFTLGTSWNNAKGYVWAGCKMENIGAGKTYTAKFTATDGADPYTKALDLNSKTEADGTITFDAVLNTTKTGVTFNVVED